MDTFRTKQSKSFKCMKFSVCSVKKACTSMLHLALDDLTPLSRSDLYMLPTHSHMGD